MFCEFECLFTVVGLRDSSANLDFLLLCYDGCKKVVKYSSCSLVCSSPDAPDWHGVETTCVCVCVYRDIASLIAASLCNYVLLSKL